MINPAVIRIRLSRADGLMASWQHAASEMSTAFGAKARETTTMRDRAGLGTGIEAVWRSQDHTSMIVSPAEASRVLSVLTERPTTACGSPSTEVMNAEPRPSMVKPPAQGSGSPVAT